MTINVPIAFENLYIALGEPPVAALDCLTVRAMDQIIRIGCAKPRRSLVG
jgi:hypothetical protein